MRLYRCDRCKADITDGSPKMLVIQRAIDGNTTTLYGQSAREFELCGPCIDAVHEFARAVPPTVNDVLRANAEDQGV